jgi:protocatechuate 4,5-dioxygenase alpha chain
MIIADPRHPAMRTRLYSLEELDDIPGTTVFNAMRSRQAYHLHKFCMSLMEAANRDEFRKDEQAYLNRFRMSDEQKQAVLNRDFNQLIELGGNIYFLVKLSNTDGWSTQKAVGSMTGMTPDEYAAMMRAGGRSIKGNRSIRGKN